MYHYILNIKFIDSDYKTIVKKLKNGAFMVVPSGPGLSTIDYDLEYYKANQKSSFALPDSGFMVLLYKLFYRKNIKKFSGPKFINNFLNEDFLKKNNSIFLIDPNKSESVLNRKYLNKLNIPLSKNYQYVAPIYFKNKKIEDRELLAYLENLDIKPKFILINLGTGVQERLGEYLDNNLSFKAGIICTGAAIAFLTGSQAKIPTFIDKIYLGWFFRILQNPRIFLIRYLKAFRLVYIFILYKFNRIKTY